MLWGGRLGDNFVEKFTVMVKWLFTIVVALVVILFTLGQRYKKVSEELDTAMANIKAYNQELSAEKNTNVAYQFTISQLKNYQDSIVRALDETRKELGIKDKRLKALQYLSTGFTRVDTVVLRDTIFKDPAFKLDTIIGDKWYDAKIGLRYPSSIIVKPTFRSEKHIVVSTKKETVNPPKKFFLFRWFQKRQLVLHLDVIEKNPYAINEKSKYIEVLK